MVKAFKNFTEIQKLKTEEEKQRAWLKDYEGKNYSIAENEAHKTKWQKEPKTYYDKFWNSEINCIKELGNRTRIDFDDKNASGEKDTEKIKQNIEKVLEFIKEKKWSFIRLSHNGSSDYIWLEFNRDLTSKEKEAFLVWIAPEGSEIDLNFASHNKVFAVMFAKHWRHSENRELPVEYIEGEQIDFDSLNLIPVKNKKAKKEKEQFEYKTYKKEYKPGDLSSAILNFDKPELLENIKKELDKTHLEDDNLKMTAFLVAVSGLLKNPNKRMSMALTGDSSVGKDNVIKTILKHMPDCYLFLTGATQPALEDNAVFTKILALSEMNLFREEGANRSLLEIVKQRTEGGTSSLKKDNATGFRTTKHQRTEQGTTFYGTTDAERNEETETRFIFGNVEADQRKIIKVNANTLEKVSNINKLLQAEAETEKDSWIKLGLIKQTEDFEDHLIVLPYAKVLQEKINGKDIIDNNNPRSMRDLKRILALTTAMTFLFARQREKLELNGYKIIVSRPEDLLNTIKYTQEFFNSTYTGMDERLNGVLKIIDSFGGQWIARDEIQRQLGLSLNTIKGWVDSLEELGLVEWCQGKDLNYKLTTAEKLYEGNKVEKLFDGNKVYLKRYHKGIKNLLIRCQHSELKQLLEQEEWQKVSNIKNITDTLLTPNSHVKNNPIDDKTKGVNLLTPEHLISALDQKQEDTSATSGKIDTFGLTPFNNQGVCMVSGCGKKATRKIEGTPYCLVHYSQETSK